MLRQITLIALLAICCSGCGKKTFPSGRLTQPAGNFSYITPDGWFRTRLAGVDFVIVSTHINDGIKPNIFVDGIFEPSQLSNTVARTSIENQNHLREYAVERQNDFTTESGLSGIKLQAHHRTKQDLPLATFRYFIQDANRVISITCTCAHAVKSKYEPVFDAAMNSLQSGLTEN